VNDQKKMVFQHKLRSGNGKALSNNELAEIYDAYYLPIYRFIFRQVGDVDTSRELSSEVFHRMVKACKNDVEFIQRLTPWLYCTARNLVIDHYRRQQYRNHLPLNEELVESASSTAEVAELQISVDQTREALQKLTPDQRQVILLKFMEGLSNQEVAEALSKSVGSVKSLQHRALTSLRHLLVPSEERVIA
jgi:RNA polymerase sigma-70 factor (ECF subfamily)